MQNNDSISLTTNKLCTACNAGIVLQKFTANVIRLGDNGVMGPGFHVSYDSSIKDLYYCASCGQTFLPTLNNKLNEMSGDRKKIATELLEKTRPMRLRRDLAKTDVLKSIFHESDNGGYHVSEYADQKNLSSLIKDSDVRIKYTKPIRLPVMGIYADKLDPFIVPHRKGTKLVWWAEERFVNVPLPAREKRRKINALKKEQRMLDKRPVEIVRITGGFSI